MESKLTILSEKIISELVIKFEKLFLYRVLSS